MVFSDSKISAGYAWAFSGSTGLKVVEKTKKLVENFTVEV